MIEEAQARYSVMNLLLAARMGPRIEWLRSRGTLETVFPALTRRSDLRRSGRKH